MGLINEVHFLFLRKFAQTSIESFSVLHSCLLCMLAVNLILSINCLAIDLSEFMTRALLLSNEVSQALFKKLCTCSAIFELECLQAVRAPRALCHTSAVNSADFNLSLGSLALSPHRGVLNDILPAQYDSNLKQHVQAGTYILPQFQHENSQLTVTLCIQFLCLESLCRHQVEEGPVDLRQQHYLDKRRDPVCTCWRSQHILILSVQKALGSRLSTACCSWLT